MRAALILLAAAASLATAAAADAQSVSPMQSRVRSHGERFLGRLTVVNPYPDPRRFDVAAFDEAGEPVTVWLNAPSFILAGGARRQLLIAAPFDGAATRKVVVCVETVAAETETGRVRAQVCAHVEGSRSS